MYVSCKEIIKITLIKKYFILATHKDCCNCY